MPLFTVVYLIIMMGGTLENPDSEIYANIYQRDFFDKDIGFGILINALKSLGFSLNVSRLIIAVIGMMLINQTAKKFLKNTTYFYILYGIYPFLFDVVQVRNFLAMSLFIYAVPFLAQNKKTGKLKYISLVLIAASMQKIALLYLPVIFLRNLQKKKFVKYLLISLIVCVVLVGFNRAFLINFINTYMSALAEDLMGLENYLDVSTRYGWVLLWAQQFGNFGLVLWANKIIKRKIEVVETNRSYYEKVLPFTELIYNINLYMFMFLPLFMIDATFTRIIRNVMPLNTIVFCITIYLLLHKNRLAINNFKFVFATLVYHSYLLYLLCSGTYWDTIVVPIFTNNWVWNQLMG